MNIKRKNGFTVVELVIIIAVIAILAAVLIPTFSSIVKKASESTDIQTVRNLNTAIKIDAVHHNSMHDALAAAKANGFAVEQVRSIGSGGDNFVAWDSVNDRFVIIKKGDGVNENDKFIFPSPEGEQTGEVKDKVAYFVFYDDVPTEQTYSIYLDGNNKTLPVVVSVGFDVGENYGIESVTYTGTVSDRNIILRTNNTGTNLSVNDTTNSTIAHFGDSGNQTINSGALSFHEYGGALKATITGGHYVAEGGSIVVVLDASASDGSVIVDLESGSVQGTVKNTNTNTENTVTINGKPGAKTISFVANKENNNLKATFATPPTYTNTIDVGDDGDSLYISGVGTAPRSAYDPEHTEHKYITVSGSLIRICEICGIFEKGSTGSGSEPSEAHTHSWSGTPSWSWSGDAENEFTAVATFTCECGSTVSVIAPKGTNNTVVGPTVVNPGCTTDGRTYYTANIYFNNVLYSNENTTSVKEALGHDWINGVVTEPKCEEAGYTTYSCSRCSENHVDNYTDPLGHDIVHHEAQAATYNAAGWNAYDTCSRCEYSTYQEIPKLTVGVKFPNTDKYLYRVGNQNPVAVSSLFEGENLTVSVETILGASGEVNGGQITFSGTGVVRVTANNSVHLNLEVVDAVNATTATSATSNNVVLLNNVSVNGAEAIKVENGFAFYGNGFTVTCDGKGSRNSSQGMSEGYIKVYNGTLDNIQVIAGIYPRAYMYVGYTVYDYYLQESTNTEDNGSHYNYQLSGISVSGDSVISNCYVYGARNNIMVGSGNVKISNTTCSKGSLSNIQVKSSNLYTVTFENVTTIQYMSNDSFNSGESVEGIGILVGGDQIFTNPKIVINGSLNQFNWVSSDDANTVTSSKIAKALIKEALKYDEYVSEDQGKEYINMGIIFYNNASAVIEDNRQNYSNYRLSTISITAVSGQVYSVLSGQEIVEIKDSTYLFDTPQNSPYIPVKKIKNLPTVQPESDEFCWNNGGTVYIQFYKGNSYLFDIDQYLSFGRYSNSSSTININCEGANVSGQQITFTTAGVYEIAINVEGEKLYDQDGNVISDSFSYTYALHVDVKTPDVAKKDAEIIVDTNVNTRGVIINNNSTSSNTDRFYWFDVFDGLKIIDYDEQGVAETLVDNNSHKSFVEKIISCSYDTTKTNDAEIVVTFTLNDNRSLSMTFSILSTSNSPGNKTITIVKDSDDNSYYYVNNGGAAGTNNKKTGVGNRISDQTWYASWTIKNYTFTGTSGKPVSSTDTHTVAAGKYNGVWTAPTTGTKPGASSGDNCLVPGTLITLADGTQVPVETLTGDEMLLVWNLETGKFDSAPIMFIDSDPETEYEVIKLRFSDGTEVKVISEHGFWDYDLNKYVYLDENASQYIGHAFAKQNGAALEKVTLVDVSIETETTTAWSPVTVGHLCYFVDGMLSMPGGISGLFNIFEVDAETMSINADKMQKDIETYGLLTLDDFGGMITEEMFNAFNGQYLGVAVGKGLITWDYISYLAERYSILCE